MNYKTISQEEKDDVVVNYYKAQELDLHTHSLNKQRFEVMLKTLPEGDFKSRIEQLLVDTNSRIEEITAIIEATSPQLPTEENIAKSLLRIKAKEAL